MSTIQAIDAFLINFRYLDATGKRANTNCVERFFFNKDLTKALENEARELRATLNELTSSKESDAEIYKKFINAINTHYANVVTKRDELAPTLDKSITNTMPSNSFADISMYGPHKVTMFKSHTPYNASKFEHELIAGLAAALEHLENNGKQFIADKIDEIKKYKPEEVRTEIITFKTY